jgi:hypothetical protein
LSEKLRVINICAGPGAGKSTTAAGVFYKLKSNDINCELVTEFAKDNVWDKHFSVLDDQIFLIANQFHKMFRLIGQVEAAVTDAPFVLSWFYNNKELSKGRMGSAISLLLEAIYDYFDNTNYFLVREKIFNPKGRVYTEEESKEIDVALLKILTERKIPYEVVSGKGAADYIAKQYLSMRK